MLKRVKIQGYKSLVDVEVELQPLTVLFGPNAAGKSNFLDALQLLARIATTPNLRNAFAPPYRGTALESFTFGPKGIESLLEQEKVSLSLEVDLELSQKTIETIQHRSKLPEDISIEYDRGWSKKYISLSSLDKIQSINYLIEVEFVTKSGILSLKQENITTFDKKGKKFHVMRNKSRMSTSSVAILQIPVISALREELASWLFFYLEPRERMRQPTAVREVRHIGLLGEDIAPFLNTLRALDEPQFKAFEKALHLLIPEITGVDVSVNNRGEVEIHLMQGETPLPAGILSEGTWRILGLLALKGAKESPALLGFEEPENGIHPQRLDLIASLLTNLTYADTQVIVTTHSPTLLDALPPESLFLVRQTNGKTNIESLTHFDQTAYPSGASTTSKPNRLISERLLRGDFHV